MTNVLRRPEKSKETAPLTTPPLRQVHETECGVVALAIVLAHFGAWIPLPELRHRCRVSADGVTALSLVETGKLYGLAIRAVRIGTGTLRSMPTPSILFWERNHFVVLEGIRGDTAWINDPARGRRKLPIGEFETAYSGVAIMAMPSPSFRPIGEPKKPYQIALSALRPARMWLGLLGVAVLAESVMLPVSILALGNALEDLQATAPVAWRSLTLATTGLMTISVAKLWLAGRAINSLNRQPSSTVSTTQQTRPIPWTPYLIRFKLSRLDSSEGKPAESAVRAMTDGIRFLVAIPLLILVLGRIHPVAAILTFVSLTALFSMEQIAGRTRKRVAFLERWRPLLSCLIGSIPAIAVGVLVIGDPYWLSSVTVAALASWVTYQLVREASEMTSTLHTLPDSLGEALVHPVTRSAVTEAV